jgi:nitroreductase
MAEERSASNPTLQTIETMRSVRDFKPDPVDEDAIQTVLSAAVAAPSSSNTQPWAFVVIRDAEKKSLIGKVISDRWHSLMDAYFAALPPDRRRLHDGATRLVENTAGVPVVILACLDLERASKSEEARYASIYPAVQNLLLAAWSLGLGSCITTHASSAARGENEVKEILGMPKHVKIAALVYLGHPAGPHRPPKRIGLERVVHYDSW